MKNVWKIIEGWRRYAEDQYTVGTDPFMVRLHLLMMW